MPERGDQKTNITGTRIVFNFFDELNASYQMHIYLRGSKISLMLLKHAKPYAIIWSYSS